jgi:exosortase
MTKKKSKLLGKASAGADHHPASHAKGPSSPFPVNSPEKNSAEVAGGTESTIFAPPVKRALGALLLIGFLWAYWPTISQLVSHWQRIPDYSHGFLVVPIALLFLGLRWEQKPAVDRSSLWLGLLFLIFAGAMRVAAARYYLEPLDGWSIPFWVAGCVALLWGRSTLWWALPAIVFLLFMVPLPYSVERLMADPLQMISTKLSTAALQCLLFPAIAEGNTIRLGDETLEVARACSGLRIFMAIAAMAFAFMVLFPRPWGTKIMLMIAILPIALLANSARIVATGILFQFGWSETARELTHDMAGWFMIPLALGLFALTLFYLDRLFFEQKTADSASLVKYQTSGN